MKKIFLNFIILTLLTCCSAFANPDNKNPHEYCKKQQEIDNMLNSRLHLTEEQKKCLEENRALFRTEMQKTVKKMEFLRKEIKKTYKLTKNKIEADIKTAPLKIELVVLKQKADNIRMQNRKNFEKILDSNQKIEFEKIKQEFHEKRAQNKTRELN